MVEDIAGAFVEGFHELYTTLFQEIQFYPHDPSNTPNIYGETKDKTFLDPVNVYAKVTYSPRGPGREENEEEHDLIIKVNRKSFELAGIDLSYDGLEVLKRGMFKSFDGHYYLPVGFTPTGGVFQSTSISFEFECREVDGRYLEV